MRVVGEIPHPDCKVTLLSWNNRYLIKVEQGTLEQTFKINMLDIAGDSELLQLIDETFIQECLSTFPQMHRSIVSAMDRL